MLFLKLFLIAASMLAQAHFFNAAASDPDEGNSNVTVTDSTLAAIRARIATAEVSSPDASSPDASSPDASSPDSDRSRIESPVAAR